MTIKLFLLIISCVTIGALAQLAMKIGMSNPAVQTTLASGIGANIVLTILQNPLVIGGLFAYVVGAGLWLIVLSKADLSLVFPFSGLGFILTMLFGWLFLNENVGFDRFIGTLIIAFGAYLVAKSS